MAQPRPKRDELTQSRLIITEGPDDEAFFRELIKRRNLPPCSIRNSSDGNKKGDTGGGKTKFGVVLQGIIGWTGFANVEHILIVCDCDEEPEENFDSVVKQIRSVVPDPSLPRGYPVPTHPLVRAVGKPDVTVAMIPAPGIKGNLECICLQAAARKGSTIMPFVEAFAADTGAAAWAKEGSIGKMKLRSLLAASHERNPFIGLGKIWIEKTGLVPIDDPAFNDLADLIRSL